MRHKTITRAPFTGAPFGDAGGPPPPPPALVWVSTIPTAPVVLAANAPYSLEWKGGVAPYVVEVISGTALLNDQDSVDTKITIQIDGTNQPCGSYVFTVTDAKGTKLTATITFAAPAPLVLTTDLSDQPISVIRGAALKLSVVATGGVPPLKYRWQVNGMTQPAMTGPDYDIAATTDQDTGIYKATVTDSAPTPSSVASKTATVTVIAAK